MDTPCCSGILSRRTVATSSIAGSSRVLEPSHCEVHRFTWRACHNPYLTQTLERYFTHSLRIWYLVLERLPHLTERVREHRALLEAVRDGDAERARRIAAEHVGTFAREIRSVL